MMMPENHQVMAPLKNLRMTTMKISYKLQKKQKVNLLKKKKLKWKKETVKKIQINLIKQK